MPLHMNPQFKIGQKVKFAAFVDAGDIVARFRVLEVNGDRLLIQFICDMTIKPTQVVRVDEIVLADED